MAVEYKQGDDLANLEVLKKEMFLRAFRGMHLGSNGNVEIGAHAANAYANLLRAQAALQVASNDSRPK